MEKHITRRNFLTGSAVLVTGTLLGPARSIVAQQAPASAGPLSPALMEDLIAGNRILANYGVVDAFGHLTVRHDKNPNHFFMARSLAPALVTPADIIEYDLDARGVNVRGRGEYSERFIHAEIYRARPDVNSVVHAHSPSVVPFTVTNVPLRPIYHMGAFIGEGLNTYEIRKAAGMTDMLVKDVARGRALAQSLGDKPAVLMRGHGVAVVGPTIIFAVGRAIYLELNARVQLQAMSMGSPITYLDPKEAQAVLDSGENRGYERAWELWKKQAIGK